MSVNENAEVVVRKTDATHAEPVPVKDAVVGADTPMPEAGAPASVAADAASATTAYVVKRIPPADGDTTEDVQKIEIIDRLVRRPMRIGDKEVIYADLAAMTAMERPSFRNDADIERVVLPEGLTTLPDGYFYNCINLKEVELPSTLTEVSRYAFYGCASLQRITIPPHVTAIGEFAFNGCASLEEMVLPATVTTIGTAAFALCTNLKKLTIPETARITAIGSHWVQDCHDIEPLTIPEDLEILRTSFLYNCPNTTKALVPPAVKEMEENVFFKSAVKTVTMTNGKLWLHTAALAGLEEAEIIYESPAGPVKVDWEDIVEPLTLEELMIRQEEQRQKGAASARETATT